MKAGRIIAIAFAVLLVAAVATYLWWLRPSIEAVLQGAGPVWLSNLAYGLYPRLEAEINRLPVDFFMAKADQVIFRAGLVAAISISFSLAWMHIGSFRDSVSSFWKPEVSYPNFDGLRVAFALAAIACCYDWYGYMTLYAKAAPFYEPISFLGLLNIPFPHGTFILAYCSALLLFIMLMALNIRPRFFAIYSAVLFVVLQAFLFSFEKLDHHYATVTYAFLIFPFLVSEAKLSAKRGQSSIPGWTLQLIRIAIVGAYFLSGMEKLLISGSQWFLSDTFCQYLSINGRPVGIWLSQQPLLCTLLPTGAVLFQVLFPMVLFFPRSRWFFLPAGVLFHFSVWLMMGIGAPLHTWVWVYFFFFDMSWLGKLLPDFMKIRVACT